LSSPEGNVFCLFGYARDFCRQLDMDPDKTIAMMKEGGDYQGVVEKFEQFFPMVTFVNKPWEREEEDDEFSE